MLLRLRWGPLSLIAVSILLAVMVLGAIVSVSNISSYSTEEIAKSTPLHYTISLQVGYLEGDRRGALEGLHKEFIGLLSKLRTDIAGNVNLLASITTEDFLNMLESIGTPVRVTSSRAPIVPVFKITLLGSTYGSLTGFNLIEGVPERGSIGFNKVILDLGVREVILNILRDLGVRFNSVYYFECDSQVLIYQCPLVLVAPEVLESVLSNRSMDVIELHYTYMVNFSLEAFTVLAPESVTEASYRYSRRVGEVLNEVFGGELTRETEEAGGFIRIVVRKAIKYNYKDLTVNVQVSHERHVLAESLSVHATASLLVTAFMLSLTIPVVVVSWILARSIGELVAYDIRRYVVLGLIRGLSLRSFTLGFLTLSITTALLAVVISMILLRIFVELSSRLTMGRTYYVPSLLDLGYILLAVGVTLSVTTIVYLKVRGVLKGYTDLTQISRLYIPVEHGVWKPSTTLTLLFALSIFKYTLWITEIKLADLIRMASEIHSILLVLAIFYAVIDFFVGFIAPVIVPYYITLFLLSRRGFNRSLAIIVARVIGGGWSELVGSIAPRISSMFASLIASIAITLSFVVAAAIVRSSVLNWYNDVSEVLTARRDLGSTFFNIMTLSMSSYSAIAFMLLSGFIIVSSIVVSYTLFKNMERELSALKTRGACLRDLIRFTYPQVLTLVVIAILVSPLGIISAKGFIETFNSVFLGALRARNIAPPTLTMDFTGLSVILLAIILSLITPLALLTHMSRKLSVELVERV